MTSSYQSCLRFGWFIFKLESSTGESWAALTILNSSYLIWYDMREYGDIMSHFLRYIPKWKCYLVSWSWWCSSFITNHVVPYYSFYLWWHIILPQLLLLWGCACICTLVIFNDDALKWTMSFATICYHHHHHAHHHEILSMR